MGGGQPKRCLLRIGQRPDQPSRRADDQTALFEALALRDQRVRPDEAFRAEEAPFSTRAPMPIRQSSATVQPWRIAW